MNNGEGKEPHLDKSIVTNTSVSQGQFNTEVALVLNENPQDLLRENGVSDFEIDMLQKIFGEHYLHQNYQNIVSRRNSYKMLVDRIKEQDDKKHHISDKIMTNFSTPYNQSFVYFNKYAAPNIAHTNDATLVDLFSTGRTDLLAIENGDNRYAFNPSKIIYVDTQNTNAINDIHRDGDKKEITEVKLREDALQFVSLLPDDSVCYIISGVDDEIIKSFLGLGTEYLQKLNAEIYRTTKKGGVVMGFNYEKKDFLLKAGFQPEQINDILAHGFYCYKKE